MKINHKILQIPPYISTTWNHISALHLKGSSLVITTKANVQIEIPDLKPELIETIFSTHSDCLEQGASNQEMPTPHYSYTKQNSLFKEFEPNKELGSDPMLSFGLGNFDSLGSALQHNASQAHLPDLPEEMLSKIASIAKIIAPDDAEAIPKAEPHCNCTHCQIARAVRQGLEDQPENCEVLPQITEEEVTDADLAFQQWDIEQTGEKLFSVTNRLDTNEKYSVYLGHPVGCTCGKQGCEHILNVLKS